MRGRSASLSIRPASVVAEPPGGAAAGSKRDRQRAVRELVTTSSIVLAFGVSVAIGIVFGLYPAVRASRLDPVKALHYE